MESTVCFRFLVLDRMQAFTLSKEIPGGSSDPTSDARTLVGKVPLTEDNIDPINLFFVRQQIPLSQCDILVSVTGSQRAAEFSAPAIVNQMLKHINCTITFSYKVERA